jgi:hypothetical protein
VIFAATIVGASFVARPKKSANQLTDKQLVKRLFPAEVRQELKRVLADLNADRPKRRKQAKKRGS